MHVNQAVRGVGSRASAGVRCHGHSSNQTILSEKVNDVERDNNFSYIRINLIVGRFHCCLVSIISLPT